MDTIFYIVIPIFAFLKIGFWICVLARRANASRTHGYIINRPTTTVIRRTTITTPAARSSAPTGIENPNYNECPPSYTASVYPNQQQTGSVAPPAYDEVGAYAPPTYGQTFQTPEYVCQSDKKSLIV